MNTAVSVAECVVSLKFVFEILQQDFMKNK